MPRYQIASLHDPRLDPFRSLKTSNATRWTDVFVAEGMKLVDRVLASDCEVVSLLLGESYAEQYVARIPDGADMLIVPDAWIDQVVGFNFHRGALATARRRPAVSLATLADVERPIRLVVCPDVQNPENLGSILRLSAAFGVHGVLLGPNCADPYSRRVLRVSMGATFQIHIAHVVDVTNAIRQLQSDHNVECCATVLDADAQPLGLSHPPNRLALVFGSEGHGLERATIDACRHKVRIPIAAGVDSLNVAVAAGIFLYETALPIASSVTDELVEPAN